MQSEILVCDTVGTYFHGHTLSHRHREVSSAVTSEAVESYNMALSHRGLESAISCSQYQ